MKIKCFSTWNRQIPNICEAYDENDDGKARIKFTHPKKLNFYYFYNKSFHLEVYWVNKEMLLESAVTWSLGC